MLRVKRVSTHRYRMMYDGYKIYRKNPLFNSVVWGSLRLTPMIHSSDTNTYRGNGSKQGFVVISVHTLLALW